MPPAPPDDPDAPDDRANEVSAAGRAPAGDRSGDRSGDRFRGVHLLRLAPPAEGAPPARCSPVAQRRAGQLQRFLGELQRVAAPQLEPTGAVELLVLARSDWKRLYRHPYGLPFARTRSRVGARAGGDGHARPAAAVDVVAAADYPGRLLHRFDAVRLRAGRQGVATPGDVREFLDLLLGHEWGHALANTAGVRTRVRWLDELLATYLFLLALRDAGADAVLERVLAWARLERVGGSAERSDLGAFERRRGLGVEETLWFQGVFAERAASLLHHGWELPRALRATLPADRGAVARGLLALEPSFRPWFASFAPHPPTSAVATAVNAEQDEGSTA